MKKIFALFLALCLTLALLAGCSQADIDELTELAQTAAELAETYAAPEPEDAGAAAETVAPPSEETAAAPDETDAQETREETEPSSGGEEEDVPAIDRDGWYTSRDEVALYLHTYGELPGNFITKNEARALGWSGGGLDDYAEGCSIGGDRFGNYEGVLPDGSYHECDIDTMHASSRGAKRLVYSDDGYIYYTDDHYESFTLLYPEG